MNVVHTLNRKPLPLGKDGLNDRERELLLLLAKGYTVAEAAPRMQVNINTMRDAVRSIMDKLQASTHAEAVYRAVTEGIIK
jgi:DNA-binding NarL/FixJ family response regulator